jgi:hypothetical protein
MRGEGEKTLGTYKIVFDDSFCSPWLLIVVYSMFFGEEVCGVFKVFIPNLNLLCSSKERCEFQAKKDL